VSSRAARATQRNPVLKSERKRGGVFSELRDAQAKEDKLQKRNKIAHDSSVNVKTDNVRRDDLTMEIGKNSPTGSRLTTSKFQLAR